MGNTSPSLYGLMLASMGGVPGMPFPPQAPTFPGGALSFLGPASQAMMPALMPDMAQQFAQVTPFPPPYRVTAPSYEAWRSKLQRVKEKAN